MRYFCETDGSYIVAIGNGNNGEEITKDEFDKIKSIIQQKPNWENSIDYRLKTDLTWESYERPMPVETDEPAETLTETEQKARAFDILTGVSE